MTLLATQNDKDWWSIQVRLLPVQAWLPRPPLSHRMSDTSDRKRFHQIPPTHRTIQRRCCEAPDELPEALVTWRGTLSAPPRVYMHKGHSRTTHRLVRW